MTSTDESLVGRQVGKYTVLERLPGAETCAVYLACNERVNNRVVLKVLPPSQASDFERTARFMDEARATTLVSHPGVVSVQDAGSQGDAGLYLASKYVQGESLRLRLDRQGTLDAEQARWVLRQTAAVLQAAHAVGVIHRNVRPGNILLEPDAAVNGGERARLIGFSVAKLPDPDDLDEEHTRTGEAMGHYLYASPEQCLDSKSVTPASDVYSLGVVGYLALTGELPHSAGSPREMMIKRLQEPVKELRALIPELPEPLCQAMRTKNGP